MDTNEYTLHVAERRLAAGGKKVEERDARSVLSHPRPTAAGRTTFANKHRKVKKKKTGSEKAF